MRDAIIETDRLILLPPSLDHIEPLMAVFSDPEAIKFLGDGCPRTVEQVTSSFGKRTKCLQDHGVTLWTVALKEPADNEPAIIGDCGLLPVNWEGPEFELAYRFRKSAWGKGYATEAAIAAVARAWAASNLNQILGVTYPENTASMRVLANTGFTHRGLCDDYYEKSLELFTIDRVVTQPA